MGTPKFSKSSYDVLIVDCSPDSKKYNMKCDLVVSRDASEAPYFYYFEHSAVGVGGPRHRLSHALFGPGNPSSPDS